MNYGKNVGIVPLTDAAGITQPFKAGSHYGIDIVQSYGAPIFAGASGTVIHSGWNYGYGNCVIIDHGNGFQTLYGHCSELLVDVGEQVIQGQLIAKEGSSGYVTGAHMHFEVRSGNTKYNPIDFLEHVYY